MTADKLTPLTKNDVSAEVFNNCVAAVKFIKENYENRVTGLWLLRNEGFDGEARIVLRTDIPLNTNDYIFLEGRLSKCFGGCIVYDYFSEVLNADNNESLITDVRDELSRGGAFALYVS